jgi:cation-transporting P-type ATPase C
MAAERSEERLRVCHSIPGRLRLKVFEAKNAPDVAEQLMESLSSVKGLQELSVRQTTGSVIILYDASQLTTRELVCAVADSMPPAAWFEAVEAESPAPASWQLTPNWIRLPLSVTMYLAGTTILGLFLLWNWVRRLAYGAALSQAPLSATGVAAILGTVPLIYRSTLEFRRGHGVKLIPFLTGACLLAVFAGQALTALEIIWVLSLGLFLEGYIAERTQTAIRAILMTMPARAFVIVNGMEVEVALSALQKGDVVVVRSGDLIPVDGIVVRGEAMVDEARMTGRAFPELRSEGERAFAGSIVREGTLHIGAEKLGAETYLAHVVQMVEVAMARPTEIEKRVDRLASRLLWMGSLGTAATLALTRNLARSLTVLLIMSCPCATVLAAATAITAAIANAARNRTLIKGGVALEQAARVNTLCIDKTGTLTLGTPTLLQIVPRAPWQDPDEILRLAARADMRSTHPFAAALMQAAADHSLELPEPQECEIIMGRGVLVQLDGDRVLVGNAELLQGEGVDPGYFRAKAVRLTESGHSVLYVAKNGKLQGMIVLENRVRPGFPSILQWLRENGLPHAVLVSGDTETVVHSLAADMGFDAFRAPLLPEEKAALIQGLEEEGRIVMMVGDGVNDAPALATASLGVALGAGGAEAAIEAADVALLDDDPQALKRLVQLSHRTMDVIEQNFWIANVTNLAAIAAAFAGGITPVMGGLLHIAHTLGIMMNSSRMMGWEPPIEDTSEVSPENEASVFGDDLEGEKSDV